MNAISIPYVYPAPSDLNVPEKLYKYREINEILFKSLLMNQVWFSKPDSFNDPFEPHRIFAETAYGGALGRDFRESGILCLCKRKDDLPMWSYYGAGLRGVAIGYDTERLLRSLAPENPHKNEKVTRWKYVFDMQYSNSTISEVNGQALIDGGIDKYQEHQKIFATKSESFSHEDEIRIVIRPNAKQDTENFRVGHGLYNHSEDSVAEIVFGELVSKQNREAIIKAMLGRSVELFTARRMKDRFEIFIEPYDG